MSLPFGNRRWLCALTLFCGMNEIARASEPFTVTVPGQGWTIAFDSPSLLQYAGQSKGKNFNFRAAGEQGFNLSIFVEEPKNKKAGHEPCFDVYWPLAKRNPLIDQDSVKVSKTDTYVKVSYSINAGGENPSPNVNYYFAFKGRWIDVHVSRFPSAKDDNEVLGAFEKSLTYRASNADVKSP